MIKPIGYYCYDCNGVYANPDDAKPSNHDCEGKRHG